MNRLLSFLITLACFSFSSCIEFEREKIAYVHYEEKDELRVTLRYEGIFGNLDKGKNSQNGPYDITAKDTLNQKQIEQLESVLEKKRAFFFSNWIFEYNQNTLKEILKKEEEELAIASKVFGKPEKELIKALLDEIEVENVGFYVDAKGRLCGAQTLRLSNASKVIILANKVLGRQLKARLAEMKTFSSKTISLIKEKLKEDFPYIRLSGNLLHLSMIMNRADQVKFSENSLTQLPNGIRIEFSDEILSLKCGDKEDESGVVTMKCYNGYQANALNYIEGKYSKLVFSPKKISAKLSNFLKASK
tara:strand:+ start:123 stop:1034 length:912 start_codon:yes stop_codon:yes gene_type:complete